MGQLGEMEVSVSADVQGLVTGIDKGVSKMQSFGVAVDKLSTSTNKADAGFKKISTGSNQAANALQNLGRVAQDAPFGFIGIQNNINPLLESFQRLKAETGGTGSALKALAGSLAGAGGLGLAISVVTSVLTLFAQGMFDSKQSAESLGNELQALGVDFDDAKRKTDAFNKSIDALKGLRDINLKFSVPGEKDRISVQLGFDKSDAEEKLRELRNLEAISEEKRAKAFDLLNQKGSQGLSDLIGQYGQLSEVKKNATSLSDKDNQLLDEAIKSENEKFDIIHQQEIARIGISKLDAQAKSDLIDLNKKEDERLEKLKKQHEIKLKPFKLTKIKPEDIEKLFFDEATVTMKVPVSAELDFKKSLVTQDALGGLSGILSESEFSNINAIAELRGFGITHGIQDGMRVGVEGLRFPELNKLLAEARERFANFKDQMKSIAQSTVADAFGSIGDSLGKALTDGISLGEVFGSVFQIIGDGLKAMGKAMITYGTGIIVLKNAIKNPYLAIAAGIGLIALGSLLESAIPKFAVGTQNFRGGLAMVGERGPELVNLPKGSGVIPNDKLSGISGGQSIRVYGEFVQRGQHLVAVINQTSKANGRAF